MRKQSRRVVLLFVRLFGGWGAYLAARNARQSVARAPRILLIHPGPLGALILITPVLQALKTHLPGAHITLAVGPWSKEAVATHPAIDHLLVYRFPSYRSISPKGVKSYISMIRLARQLKRGRYDLAINLHRNFWWGAALIIPGEYSKAHWLCCFIQPSFSHAGIAVPATSAYHHLSSASDERGPTSSWQSEIP